MENTVGQAQSVQVPNYSGVNIQIFNPSVAAPGASLPSSSVNAGNYSTNPSYPSNYYMQNLAQQGAPAATPATPVEEKKKTEKREIVQLTDDYIKNVENYLNNQNKDIRLMGAKEVVARLQEDDSRKNDTALNALVNKMLQDPYQPIKVMAIGALQAKIANGNEQTKQLLQGIQQQKTSYGEDSLNASNVLLKMSGKTTQKEFEVKPKKESTAESKKQGGKE